MLIALLLVAAVPNVAHAQESGEGQQFEQTQPADEPRQPPDEETTAPGEDKPRPAPIEVDERCESLNASGCPTFLIEEISVDGLNWTRAYVVHREILFGEGESASYGEVVESIKRIRNTHIFRTVEFELLPVDDVATEEGDSSGSDDRRVARLEIEVDERWTLRPNLAFNRGGGTYRLILGVVDINFLGRLIGVGARYERFGPTNSFSFWAYDPRLFGERLRLGINAGSFNRIFTQFDERGEVEGGFLMRRFDAGAYLSREWLWWLETALGMSFLVDTMSLDFIGDDVVDLQREKGIPPDTRLLLFEIGGSIGRLNENNYNYDGQVLSVGLDVANSALGSTHDVTRVDFSGQFFRELPLDSNVGVRLATGFADAEVVQHEYYLGGLDAIRGFAHDRFRGEQYWLAGAEYRIPSIDHRWFVLQHIVFADAAHISRDIDDYIGLSAASVGVGLRLIIPKIDGFNARIDYAFPIYGSASNPLSFGGGQFF